MEECRCVIEEAIGRTESLVALGAAVAEEELNSMACLPAVPDLKDVPYFCLEDDETVKDQILEMSSTLCAVCYMAPVQVYYEGLFDLNINSYKTFTDHINNRKTRCYISRMAKNRI